LGYDKVHYLPLATDENVFQALPPGFSPAPLACDLSFSVIPWFKLLWIIS
jgi:hypothetical protein